MTEAGWVVRELEGTAADLHHRPPAAGGRVVEICRVTGRALVLGSTQGDDVVDRAAVEAAGVEVTRRRSGGGAVLLDPAGSVWIDVTVPRGDDLWDDDVNRSFGWLGDRWVAALAELGVVGEVHRGPLDRTAWTSLVCFAGLGPGEVTVGGHKVVGLSQRRTREAARFQSVVYLRSMPHAAAVVDLLAADPDPLAGDRLRRHLDAAVGVLDASPAAVVSAFLAALA